MFFTYELLLALVLIEPSAIAANKTAAEHIFSVAFLSSACLATLRDLTYSFSCVVLCHIACSL